MSTPAAPPLSRRAFLELVGLSTVTSLLAACAPAAAPSPTSAPPPAPAPTAVPVSTTAPAAKPTTAATAPTAAPTAAAVPTSAPASSQAAQLKFWYWPGTSKTGKDWATKAIDAFAKAQPNIKIDLTEKGADIDTEIRTAAASKSGPDIFFYWDGYFPAWLGWSGIAHPVDKFVDPTELAHWKPIEAQSWNGHPYQAPWRLDFVVLAYNKQLFKQAGVDPDKPPDTWSGFLDAMSAVKEAGITPLKWGAKSGGGNYLEKLAEFITNQSIDSTDELKRLVTGERSANDPVFKNMLTAIRDLRDRELLNDDIMSVPGVQMYDEFTNGNAAVSFLPESRVIDWFKKVGPEVAGIMPFPKYANGKLGDPHLTSPVGFAVATWASAPEAAVKFIEFTHSAEQVNGLYKTAGYIPADDRFDVSLLETPIEKTMWQWFLKGSSVWPWDWVPPEFTDQMFAATASIVSESKDPDTVAKDSQEVFDRWREKDAETVQHYKDWIGHA